MKRRNFIASLFALPFLALPKTAKPKEITFQYTADIQPAIDEINKFNIAIRRLDREQTAEFLKGQSVITGPTIKFPTST